MRQLMFSRVFPKGHPKEFSPTYFVEKIWAGLADQGMDMDGIDFGNYFPDFQSYYNRTPKVHTIRAGHRWKVGDWFTPRIWSGKAYRSKTLIFAPPLDVKKVWNIDMLDNGVIHINGKYWEDYKRLAVNDGLTCEEFTGWFRPGLVFDGQIICWNDKIEY